MENMIQYLSFFIICVTLLFFLYSLFSYKRLIPFYKKFIIPEFFYLCGKKYINLFILFCIISLSLFAMGFGNGLISHLSKKMNDPFVSFVDVAVKKGFSIQEYYKKFASINQNKEVSIEELFLDNYGLEEAPSYIFQSYEDFKNPISGLTKNIKIQEIDLSSKLYQFLVEENKFLSDYNKFTKGSGKDFGVIISADWLRENPTDDISTLVFPQYLLFIKYGVNTQEIYYPIPVVGVVERLPEGVGALVQEPLFDLLQQDTDAFSLLGKSGGSFRCFVSNTSDSVFIENFPDSILFELTPNYITGFSPKRLNQKNPKENIKNFDKSGYFEINPDTLQYSRLKKIIEQYPDKFFQFFDYYRIDAFNASEAGRVQFKFKNTQLDKIEKLSLFLRNFSDQEVDMSIVKSKQNFDLFNKLAISLSAILAFFSIVSVILYITNLVTSHISRNKKNLGTLKAFGLSNSNITFIYSCISLGIVFIAFFVSYFLCQLVGTLLIKYLTSNIFNIKDTSAIIYQSYSLYTLCGIFIGVPFLFILFKLTKSLKNSTPGDLIYERD